MQIKVCGLTEMVNLSFIVRHEPDYIGLIFYPGSKRYIKMDEGQQARIKDINSVQKVGVFLNANYNAIQKAIDDFGLNFVQLHGDETPDFCASLSKHIKIIKAFPVDKDFDFKVLANYEPYCTYFLFDTASSNHGGSGKTFDWRLLKRYTLQKNYFLSGGISLENIDRVKAIKDPRLMAVDVNSCFEISPGIKSINKVKKVIHELRN